MGRAKRPANIVLNMVTVVFGDDTIQFKPVQTELTDLQNFVEDRHDGCRFGIHDDLTRLFKNWDNSDHSGLSLEDRLLKSLGDFRLKLLAYISNSREDVTEPMKNLLKVLFELRIRMLELQTIPNMLITLNRPEMGLHPKLQQELIKVLLPICSRFSIPILIVTDSVFVLRAVEVYRSNHEYTYGFQLIKVGCNDKRELTFEDCTAYPEGVWREFAYVLQACEDDYYRYE